MAITKAALTILFLAILATTLVLDYNTYVEFYGSGPPYYNQTTNMDKWVDPMPGLIITNSISFVISTTIVLTIWKIRKK
jgi:multisubunit Na+/H+ antiporter MnhC subunit